MKRLRLTEAAKHAYAGAMCLAMCGTFGYVMAGAVLDEAPTPVPSFDNAPTGDRFHVETPLELCAEEDSNNCVWPADWIGNGQGRPFYADSHGNVTYIEPGEWAYVLDDGTYVVHIPPTDAEYLP